jgi:hypothetical protein
MFTNVSSSFLFLIPIALAMYYRIYDVAIASTLCFTTSIIYHTCSSYDSQYTKTIKYVDIFTVNAVATVYTCHAILLALDNYSFIIVPIISMFTVAIYFTKTLHILVHFLSIFGICVYVVLRHLEKIHGFLKK